MIPGSALQIMDSIRPWLARQWRRPRQGTRRPARPLARPGHPPGPPARRARPAPPGRCRTRAPNL